MDESPKGSISIPYSIVMALLAGGLGTGVGFIGEDPVTSGEVSVMIANREEITELKLSNIDQKLSRIEEKLDTLQTP